MNIPVDIPARPEHVPEDALFEFDIADPELAEDPHRIAFARLKEAPAVFWTPCNGGHWMTRCYAESFEVLTTPEIFSSDLVSEADRAALGAALPPDIGRLPSPSPINLDPPEHSKYRIPLQESFSPKAIHALQGDITLLAEQLVDAIAGEGSCDFIEAVGEQFPVRVFLNMMGLPDDRIPEFRNLVREIFIASSDNLRVMTLMRRVADVMGDVIRARQEEPRDDLISRIWALEIDGEPMTLEGVEDYACLLFIAGLDTVVNAIGFGMRHLAMHPELQRQLRAHPEQIADATEEMLRRYTMVMPIRRVCRPVSLGGWELQPGDKIIAYLPMADLDEQVYKNPESIEIERNNKEFMAFGKGPHHCLGVHLARLELRTLYRTVLERLPEFRLDPDRPPQIHPGQMLAINSLPIRWD